jgi:hypothetical protein
MSFFTKRNIFWNVIIGSKSFEMFVYYSRNSQKKVSSEPCPTSQRDILLAHCNIFLAIPLSHFFLSFPMKRYHISSSSILIFWSFSLNSNYKLDVEEKKLKLTSIFFRKG